MTNISFSDFLPNNCLVNDLIRKSLSSSTINGIDLLNLEATDLTRYAVLPAQKLWSTEELLKHYITDGEKGKSDSREPFSSEDDLIKIYK